MRLRNIPSADQQIAINPYCIQDPASHRGVWQHVFQNTQPLHIEIGMGKGRFILQLAQTNPDINYIGIERYTSVLLRAVQKLERIPADEIPSNLRFICMDAEQLSEVFAPNEVNKIYLNFSDPWPKKRHARRRLTSQQFLQRYDQILTPNGTIEFKTDNQQLFAFSLNELPAANWTLNACTYDLHNDSILNNGNIITEYEEKFSSLGNPIYKLIASRSVPHS